MTFRPEKSDVVHRILGHLGEKKVTGTVAMLREDAFCKCSCGATMLTALDHRLHTSNTGICTALRRGSWKEITSGINSY